MPLTEKGEKIKRSMEKHYGEEKGEDVFYASQQKKVIKGTHHSAPMGEFHDKRTKL